MISIPSCLRAAIASLLLASVAVPASAATTATRYFVSVPESQVPLPIAAFSSDARADVAAFSYGSTNDARPARGKFSIRTTGSPFEAGQTYPTVIVLAQTPAKLITFTFTNVTIDAADQTAATSERVTFEATNYSIKYAGGSTGSGHTAS